jgi:phage baseplate assembly protein W
MPPRTRTYKDLDLNFLVHPNTKDLVYVKDVDSIKKAVKNIVLTNFYERHFNDSFGCHIRGLLFEPMSFFTALSIQQTIEEVLTVYEPRIELISVDVEMDEQEENGYDITITFSIKNQVAPIKIEFFLERVK